MDKMQTIKNQKKVANISLLHKDIGINPGLTCLIKNL